MKKKWATNERTTNLREPFVETLGISKSKIIIKPFLYELFRRYLDDGKSRMRRSYLLLLHFRSDKKQKITPDAPTFRVFLQIRKEENEITRAQRTAVHLAERGWEVK